ncbi:EPIDERMAL PATTERNING FACTOR-like protein 2 [Coffea arabica]|uniref:Epidermal patterning factor-like protein n=1 Tax=Coffea arabica TaxID=13443 RepID=A0A6P6UQ74_COFAR|nr:EPIDERMAL PATTERNING FACTOR-like protein 2 isoform X1 [Coffea arabica]
MGSGGGRIFHYRNRHLLTFVLFLLITRSNPFKIIAEGRATPKLQVQSLEANQKRVEEKVVMVRSLIGSRPPRCERRCMSCGHCEAVQVPIVPSLKHQKIRSNQFFATPTIAYSRGDDISNYKPMCWKCKCGNFIFNP